MFHSSLRCLDVLDVLWGWRRTGTAPCPSFPLANTRLGNLDPQVLPSIETAACRAHPLILALVLLTTEPVFLGRELQQSAADFALPSLTLFPSLAERVLGHGRVLGVCVTSRSCENVGAHDAACV
jgi:hypothetical protein